MAGHRNFHELRDRLAQEVGEERLAEDARQVRESYRAELRRLADVRKARALTQTQLAQARPRLTVVPDRGESMNMHQLGKSSTSV